MPKKKRRPDDPSPTPAYTPDSILTDRELAAYLKLKPHTLRVWRLTHHSPHLPFIRIGRSIRYKFSAVQAWLNGNVGAP
jgi:excisionase family DNA binding protein